MDNNNIVKSITFLNWNANGTASKRSSFIHFIQTHDVEIACITETHLSQKKPFRIPGFLSYRSDRTYNKAVGGVAIFIKKTTPHFQYPTPTDPSLELSAIQLNYQLNPNVIIVSAYRPPNKPTDFTSLIPLLNNHNPIIIMGDLNTRETWET